MALLMRFWVVLLVAGTPVLAQKLTWSRIWGSTNGDEGAGIARDRAGYLYVAGTTQGGFDGETNSGPAGTRDAFLSKYDTNGVRLWTRIWGSGAQEDARGVAVDRLTNVYVCGRTAGGFHGETNTRAGTMDLFLTQWTADGTWVWTRIWGSTNQEDGAGVVCDSARDVYVGGTTDGQFGTPGQTNAKAGSGDFCLTKFSPAGLFQWSRIWGGTNSDRCTDVAQDPNADYLYLVGTTFNGVFDGQTNHTAYDRLALTACDSSGHLRWSRVWGATNRHNSARGVSADAYVYVAGSSFGRFDGETNRGLEDVFITQFDESGNRNWTRTHGTNNIEQAVGVVQDIYGNAYVLGVAYANLDGQIRVGLSDFMLLKYDPAGSRIWTRLWGSSSDDTPVDLVLEGTNALYACVTVYAGFGGQAKTGTDDSAALSRWRLGANTPPGVSIQRPLAGREFLESEVLACVGSGIDLDDGPSDSLFWQFGTNPVFSAGATATLSALWVGAQTVTAYAVDTEFATGKAAVVVNILPADDGLPAAWQAQFWPGGESGGPTGDADRDGADNWTEWVSGTNPTNADSLLSCEVMPVSPGQPLVMRWTSASNRDYAISSSTNWTEGFMPLGMVTATPPLNTYTSSPPAAPRAFYRVEVVR